MADEHGEGLIGKPGAQFGRFQYVDGGAPRQQPRQHVALLTQGVDEDGTVRMRFLAQEEVRPSLARPAFGSFVETYARLGNVVQTSAAVIHDGVALAWGEALIEGLK